VHVVRLRAISVHQVLQSPSFWVKRVPERRASTSERTRKQDLQVTGQNETFQIVNVCKQEVKVVLAASDVRTRDAVIMCSVHALSCSSCSLQHN